ncbi:MAG: TolC family outer membrane protein [Alphaproteobacteria bacterium]
MGYRKFLSYNLIAVAVLAASVSASALAAGTRVDVMDMPIAEALTQLTANPAPAIEPDKVVEDKGDPAPSPEPEVLPEQPPEPPTGITITQEPKVEEPKVEQPPVELKVEEPKVEEKKVEAAPEPEVVIEAPPKPIKKKKKAKLKDSEERTAEVADEKALLIDEVLAEVYSRNPELQAARAELRAVDETYAQAFSGFRPVVTAEAAVSSSHDNGDNSDSHADPKGVALGLEQSIYSGGSTLADMRASSNVIKAQRALLHSKEQQVLLEAVKAYLDVLRDQEILNSNRNNTEVLSQRLKEARERLRLGDITRTDVSQAESRHAQATAERVAAEGFLKSSRAAFEKVSGLTAEKLKRPGAKLALPATLDEALEVGDRLNPVIIFTQYSEQAAAATTRSIQGELYPQVGVSGGLDHTYDPTGSGNDQSTGAAVTLRATLPLYSGGSTASRIRQSRQVESQRRIQIRQAEREVKQAVTDAWSALVSARAQAEARAAEVKASGLARKNVKAEAEYGSRTTLDLLDAEQEYRNARVAQAIADHDAQLAAYGLLAATGRLTAQELGLAAPLYDPTKNFQKVKNKWFGTKVEMEE